MIMDWSEGKNFRILAEEGMTHAKEPPLYNKLPENEKKVCSVCWWVLLHCGKASEMEYCFVWSPRIDRIQFGLFLLWAKDLGAHSG